MNAKKFFLIITGVFLLLILPACDKKLPEKDKTRSYTQLSVTESYHTLLFLPFYLAIDQGFFLDEGIDIALETAWSQEDAFNNLVDKKTSVLLGSPETVFYHLQQNNNTPIIHLAQVSCESGFYLLARKTEKPFSWLDLKGKTVIGCKDGELPQVLFEYLLKKNSLKPLLDVHIIQNIPHQIVQGVFLSGTGNYMLAMEPEAARLEINSESSIVAALSISSGPLVTSGFMTTHAFLKENPDICQSFLQAIQEGLNWINEHTPEEIIEAGKKFFPTEDEKILLRAVSRYKTLGIWPLEAIVDENGLTRLQEILLERKELNSFIPLDDLIYKNDRID